MDETKADMFLSLGGEWQEQWLLSVQGSLLGTSIEMNPKRDGIANQMWEDYSNILSHRGRTVQLHSFVYIISHETLRFAFLFTNNKGGLRNEGNQADFDFDNRYSRANVRILNRLLSTPNNIRSAAFSRLVVMA